MAERVEIEIIASDKASKVFGDVNGALITMGDALTNVGQNMTIGITAPLALLGASAVQEFGAFEEAIQRAGAFVNASAAEMDGFRDAAISAAQGTKFSFEETANALGAFVGGEISAEEATQNLADVVNLALVANMSDLQNAVNLGSLALTVFADDGMAMSDVMDIIASVASNVTTETDAWATSLTNSAASAASAGFSFEDLNVIFAEMVRGGADVNALWASFNAAMVNIQSPGKQATEALSAFGLSVTDMQTALASGPVELLAYLKTGFDEANKSGQGFAFLADVLGRQAAPEFALALGLTNEEMADTAGYFDEITGAGDDMVDRLRDSISPLEQMGQAFDEIKLLIGEAIVPYFKDLVGVVQIATGWFRSLSPEGRNVVVMFGLVAAAIGPLLIIIGTLIGAVGTIGTALSAVGLTLSGVLLPILAIAAALGVVYLAWTNNWLGIRDLVDQVWAFLQPIFDQIRNYFQQVLPIAISVLSQYWTGVLLPQLQMVLAFLQENVFPLLGSLAELLGTVVGLAVQVLAGLFTNYLLPAIKTIWSWVAEKLMPAVTKMAEFMRGALKPAIDAVAAALKALKSFIDSVIQALKNLKIPKWLTPGSPTPLELGLRGINEEMAKLARAKMPALSVASGGFGQLAYSTPALMGGGNTIIVHTSSLVSLDQRYQAEQVLGPMIEDYLKRRS